MNTQIVILGLPHRQIAQRSNRLSSQFWASLMSQEDDLCEVLRPSELLLTFSKRQLQAHAVGELN